MEPCDIRIDKLKVDVVIVTYGDRWKYLYCILEHLEYNMSVSNVVIIDNNSTYSVSDYCQNAAFNKVIVHRNNTNVGSAGGFSKGITVALENGADLLLLLDDDNLPRLDTIQSLVKTYSECLNHTSSDRLAVIAFRECQHGQFRMPLKPIYKIGHDFLNFNLFNKIQRSSGLIEYKETVVSGPEFAALNRGGAYSGMLFSKELIQKVGLPQSDYVLYFDDVEFVIRILNAGGVVWLDVNSLIDDIVGNYSISVFKVPILGFVLSASDAKVYYMVRNRMYIDSYLEHKKSFTYKINKYVFTVLTLLSCLVLFKISRFISIVEASWHARQGRLGLNPHYRLK